ncbi:alginate export family protein [Lunatimonas sp.]|uniref:alginate export family protein n=1 Tax=Lunatimonas sp. TaxID=2060141 RepID=UPI00263A9D9B|nr:alginate export family protein [Lunatimonas sp.]
MNQTSLFRYALIAMCMFSARLQAQFEVDGQLIQRSEYRNGFSRLIDSQEDPAFFIAHRARLQANYKMDNLTMYMSVQDVRVWGSTPQVKATDNLLSVHEAWAEISLSETWSLKLGRQELNYDNFRFLGNLDWALQGRAHDIALAKHEKNNRKIHVGAAFNQNDTRLAGTLFTVPNQYKAAQMLRYENSLDNLSFSLLFWNDGRQFSGSDSLGNQIIFPTYFRQTFGIPTLRYTKGASQLSGYYYYQTGKEPTGRSTRAYNYSLTFSQKLARNQERGSGLTLLAGLEVLSGTATNDRRVNRSFSPLYGTNHLFNGYMDHFFVGGTHENSVGLEDYFVKSRYAFNTTFFVQLDMHVFHAQSSVYRYINDTSLEPLPRFLGNEIDLSVGYLITDALSLQGGYSQLFHSDTFAFLQGQATPKTTQNWAYLMLIVRPTMKNKFIGILL